MYKSKKELKPQYHQGHHTLPFHLFIKTWFSVLFYKSSLQELCPVWDALIEGRVSDQTATFL